MENINKIMRKKNYNNIRELMKRGIPYFDALKPSIIILQCLQLNDPKQLSVIYLTLGVYFLDYYTKLIYQRNENHMAKEEFKDYLCLAHLENFQDVIQVFQEKPNMLLHAVDASYQFSSMNIFGKINMVKNLSESEHQYLNDLIPTHLPDQKMYDSWVDPELYQRFYAQEYQIFSNQWEDRKQDYVLPTISSFLRNLAKHDYYNYSSNIGEMTAYDYLYSKYLLDYGSDLSSYDINQMKYRTRFLEKNTYEMLIHESFYNPEYMHELLDTFLSIKTGMFHCLQENITEEQIQKYVETLYPQGYSKIKEFL